MRQRLHLQTASERQSKMEAVHLLPTRLIVHTSEGSHVIPWKDILYCSAMSNYSAIHLSDGRKIVVSKTLGSIESVLPKREFFRIHQSHLVSLSSIRFASISDVQLEGHINLPVSRSRRKELINRISEISIDV